MSYSDWCSVTTPDSSIQLALTDTAGGHDHHGAAVRLGPAEMLQAAGGAGKLQVVNPGSSPFDPIPVLWVILLGSMFQNLVQYGSDQAVVQRYMTTETEGKAARAIWTNGFMSVGASILFFASRENSVSMMPCCPPSVRSESARCSLLN